MKMFTLDHGERQSKCCHGWGVKRSVYKTQTLISTWRVLLWSERRRRSVEDTAMMSFLAFDGSIAKVQVNANVSVLFQGNRSVALRFDSADFAHK